MNDLAGSKFEEVKELFESLGCEVVVTQVPQFFRYTMMNDNGGVTKSTETVLTRICSASYKRDIARVVAEHNAIEVYLLHAEMAWFPAEKLLTYRACLFDDESIKKRKLK